MLSPQPNAMPVHGQKQASLLPTNVVLVAVAAAVFAATQALVPVVAAALSVVAFPSGVAFPTVVVASDGDALAAGAGSAVGAAA